MLTFTFKQILESGAQATSVNFPAARRQTNWVNFVEGIPTCSSLSATSHTFDCIRRANTSEILTGILNSIGKASELFGFDPTIDGPGGLYPNIPSELFEKGRFARVPFITGTNLDEGEFLPPLRMQNQSSSISHKKLMLIFCFCSIVNRNSVYSNIYQLRSSNS